MFASACLAAVVRGLTSFCLESKYDASKVVYLRISKLPSILTVANLLAHNKHKSNLLLRSIFITNAAILLTIWYIWGYHLFSLRWYLVWGRFKPYQSVRSLIIARNVRNQDFAEAKAEALLILYN